MIQLWYSWIQVIDDLSQTKIKIKKLANERLMAHKKNCSNICVKNRFKLEKILAQKKNYKKLGRKFYDKKCWSKNWVKKHFEFAEKYIFKKTIGSRKHSGSVSISLPQRSQHTTSLLRWWWVVKMHFRLYLWYKPSTWRKNAQISWTLANFIICFNMSKLSTRSK